MLDAAVAVNWRIETAGRHAGVHELIAALPRGYDTLLTRMVRQGPERDDSGSGVPLSGGQWQRLALARAFLRRKRDLMILDEPSAGLDAEAEHEIHTRLREIRAGRTGILISHRLGAVRDAGLIAVLEDGVIAEQGGHEELLGADSTYAQRARPRSSVIGEVRRVSRGRRSRPARPRTGPDRGP
ncbi:ATP-binding cassette domain-containing protein [Nonomuraea sp. JJY05]|uniref:ATP-binding cassette domain-containing protein n=1 Tax=Nonomuraea sp. JJY05 TaxID=3350255 RepID=UPI00373F8470